MEFLVCMLLASLITGGRITSDIIHGLKGTTPPHVEKARIKADKARAAAEAAAAKTRQTGGQESRSPYADGKPRLRDVAAVYWGDALQDAIDAHNKRREEKKNPQPAVDGTSKPAGPSLPKRVWDLMVRPVGESPQLPEPAAEPAGTNPATGGHLEFRWFCDLCGVGRDGYLDEDEANADGQTHINLRHSGKGKVTDPPPIGIPDRADENVQPRPTTPAVTTPPGPRSQHDPGPLRRTDPPAAAHPARDTQSGQRLWTWQCKHCGAKDDRGYRSPDESNDAFHRDHAICPVAGPMRPEDNGPYYFRCNDCGFTTDKIYATPGAGIAANKDHPCPTRTPNRTEGDNTATAPTQQPSQAAPTCALCGYRMVPTFAQAGDSHVQFECPACDIRFPGPPISEPANQPTEGDNMTQPTAQTGSSATGDAHDLESASQQCNLLHDDLVAIDTALDLIDEKISSAGNAAELIEAFLTSKNVSGAAVGGMSQARDMLSPDRIKALMDAIGAAKAGAASSKEAIDAMNDQATEALQGADGSVVNGR